MSVPTFIKQRSFQEHLEHFVGDCQHILIAKREDGDLERRDAALRVILALGPEVETVKDFSQG